MDRLDYQQQAELELHQRTIEALEHAKALGATEDDLVTLCFHAGIDYKEIRNG